MPLFVPEMSATFTSYIVQNIYIALAWTCIHCILSRFLWSKKPKHSSSNQGLCCLNLSKPRLSFADVCIFYLMFSQVLFTSSSPFKFSKAVNQFIISIWYCSLTSGSFSFLKLNLCLSNLCAACLPTVPKLCNHQIVICNTISSPRTSHIQFTRIKTNFSWR